MSYSTYLVAVAFSHHFPYQYLGHYVQPFVLNASNDIAPLLLLQLVFLLHGFCERQVSALASYFHGVSSRTGKVLNPMNQLRCNGNRLLQPQVPLMD